jgi:hypothetical protein
MGYMLIIGGLMSGYYAYKEDNTMLFVFAIVFGVLGTAIEIVEMILDHRKEIVELESRTTKDLTR